MTREDLTHLVVGLVGGALGLLLCWLLVKP